MDSVKEQKRPFNEKHPKLSIDSIHEHIDWLFMIIIVKTGKGVWPKQCVVYLKKTPDFSTASWNYWSDSVEISATSLFFDPPVC